ncbi:MAG: divalent-cation tolerance protein CutA [Candidatus Micrarchaeia archaeon]
MLLVFVSFASEMEARRICEALVKEKLCACASLYPVRSIYGWKGKLVKEGEWEAALKCSERKWGRLQRRIKELHSYEVPQIIAVKARANAEYARWVEGASPPFPSPLPV